MDQIPTGTNLFTIPYQNPPDNVKSDFEKPSDLLILFRTLVPVMIFLITVLVVVRIRARFGRDEQWRMDDWFTVATWMTTSALGVLIAASVQKLGRSTWDISLGFLISAWPQRVLVSMAFVVALSLLLGKVSLLTLYYRIFGHIERVRHQLYWTAALCFPLLAACIISPILASPPPGKSWGTPNPHNKENSIVTMAIGVQNIIVDLLILYIPIPNVIGMNLSRKKKAGVLAIFLTGSIAIIADAIVMYYRVRLWKQIDPLRDGMIVGLCSFIEACISIVCSSMPSAAKVWNVYIVPSNFYVSLRSQIGSTPKNHDRSLAGDPGELQHVQPVRKRTRGLYSIGTFPTTNASTSRLSKADGFIELGSYQRGNSGHHSTGSGVPEQGNHGISRDLQHSESREHPPLSFNDPSNYLSEPEHVV